LLSHTSGLPAFMDLTHCTDDEERLKQISQAPRVFEPGSRVLYSDLNFIVLGLIAQEAATMRLDELFAREVAQPLGLHAQFNPPAGIVAAATEWDESTQKYWCGTVHDENARAMGGIAGHAGLFARVADVLVWGQALLNQGMGPRGPWLSPAAVHALMQCRTQGLAGEKRTWGFQRPFPQSSAGDLLSSEAIGHTGFTGTSVWIDGVQDAVLVLLTNRVHYGRDNQEMLRLRPLFHNVAMTVLSGHIGEF
ncbi:MAG: serine hydrolase, partial [Firmicutes bacterium]|nr:serine hydrolase [Bacillota bacterium]